MEYTDITPHERWFAAYAQSFCDEEATLPEGNVAPLVLKIEHTHHVLAHAQRIVAAEHLDHAYARACLLAALYHDVARFAQYTRWHTFKDSLSKNHGLMGVGILKKEQRLASETRQVRKLVFAAVGMHNRYAVPASVPGEVRLVTNVVRDADKVDILRIMAGHLKPGVPYDKTVLLSVKDDPMLWTPKVVDDILQGKIPSYVDLRSVNDFRLLLGSWINDVCFAVSQKYIEQQGIVPEILAPLPQIDAVQQARQYILAELARV